MLSISAQNKFMELRRKTFEKKYSFLNSEQRKAVFSVNGPLLILAGAGSGKTTVIVNRIAFLVEYGNAYMNDYIPENIDESDITVLESFLNSDDNDYGKVSRLLIASPVAPYNILAITFTNKAANELKERLIKILGDDGEQIWASTFHSACVRILRREIHALGYDRNFTIYDSDDTMKLIKEGLKELNIDDSFINHKAVYKILGKAKNAMMTPEDFLREYENDARLKYVGKVYSRYQKRLKEANALDFDDIIMKTVELLDKFEDVRTHYQNLFKYILVDEYQDTNGLQYRLVSLLTGKNGNLCVVGDDDQSIYKFRGATIENILSFEKQYKDALVIRLEQNYRSTKPILDAANKVIENNLGRKGKSLWTAKTGGEKINVYCANDQNDEGGYIVKRINELCKEGRDYNDFAVLYRTNAQNRAISDALTHAGIANRVIGGTRFYDRKEIKDVVAYLSVIANPKDDLRLTRIINEPSRKIGAATMQNLRIVADSLGVSLYEAIENCADYPLVSKAASKLMGFFQIIDALRLKAEFMPLNELYDEMLDATGYVEALRLENNEEAKDRIANISELSSSLVEYMKKSEEPTLSSFLEEIALVSDIDNLDRNAKAVTLMTLHSAKGLEFPVVFIAGVEEGLFPSGQSSFDADELEEERRLAYVGITRAKQLLHLIYCRERTIYGSTQRVKPSRFIGEIPGSLIDFKEYKTTVTHFERREAPSTKTELFSKMAEKPHSVPTEEFSNGQRVSHRVFGQGTVLSSTIMANDVLLEIAFDKQGTKKIMANFAGLKKI